MLLWVQKRVPCERLASSDHCVLDYQLAATRKYNPKILVAIVSFFSSFLKNFAALALCILGDYCVYSGWNLQEPLVGDTVTRAIRIPFL